MFFFSKTNLGIFRQPIPLLFFVRCVSSGLAPDTRKERKRTNTMNHLLALITTDNNVCGHWSNPGRKQTTAMVLDRRLMLCCRPLLFWSTRLWLGFFSFPNERGNRALFPLLPTHTDIHRLLRDISEKENSSPSVVRSFLSLILFFEFSNIFLKF